MKSVLWFPVALLSVFTLIGFVMLGIATWNAWRSTSARAWPTTQGTIKEVTLKTNQGSDDSSPTYRVDLRYTYAVNGANYEGTRLAFGYGASSYRDSHSEIYQKLKRAKLVSVRYDPADPASSCVSFGLNHSIRSLLLFSIVWLGFVAGMACLWWMSTGNDDVLLQNMAVE